MAQGHLAARLVGLQTGNGCVTALPLHASGWVLVWTLYNAGPGAKYGGQGLA